MKFTESTRYGLRALVRLAEHPETSASVRELHQANEIPHKYLGRLMVTLRDAGLVSATRGKQGGYRLARDSSAISIEEVVAALQGLDDFHACMFSLQTCAFEGRPCALHSRMEPVRAALLAAMRSTTLADLARGAATAPDPGSPPSQTQLFVLART